MHTDPRPRPYDVDGELSLLREHRIDVVVTKDSGGPATSAKLEAARRLRIPVVVIRRPPLPSGVDVVDSVAQAAKWLTDNLTPVIRKPSTHLRRPTWSSSSAAGPPRSGKFWPPSSPPDGDPWSLSSPPDGGSAGAR